MTLVLVVPYAIVALLLSMPDELEKSFFSVIPWYVVWLILLVPGIGGIHVLAIPHPWKLGLTTFYVPTCLASTAIFTFWFACGFQSTCF